MQYLYLINYRSIRKYYNIFTVYRNIFLFHYYSYFQICQDIKTTPVLKWGYMP